MISEKQKELYFSWYKRPEVKYEIIKFLKNRELVLLNRFNNKLSVRMLRCHSIQHLDFILNNMLKIEEQNKIYNFYYSMAFYENGIPYQSAKLNSRDNSEWTKTHFNKMVGYDFLIDVDASDFNEVVLAYETTKEIKRILDKLVIPYELRFSGCGFHFLIPYRYLPQHLSFNPFGEKTIYGFCKRIAKVLYDNVSEMIDFSIYDSRRVCKIPYSLAIYDNRMMMCLPILNNKQFEDFLKDFSHDKYYYLGDENFVIRNRGTYVFNEGGELKLEKELLQNLK